MKSRLLCLWLPRWTIQRRLFAPGELDPNVPRNSRGQPDPLFVIYARKPRRGEIVVACSAAAERAGARVGMPVAEAQSLKKRGSRRGGWRFEPHDPESDRAALAKLIPWCERFSPFVGLEDERLSPDHQPESLFGDVTGLGPLFGSERQLAEQFLTGLQSRGYAGRAAIADTLGAAWAMTHFGEPADENLFILPPGDPTALAPLPIAALRLPGETVDLLEQLGIARIESLLQLPRSGLSARLGPIVALRIDQALGTATEPIAAWRPDENFSASWPLAHPLTDRAVLGQIFARLVERLATVLAARDQGALQLAGRVECRNPRTNRLTTVPFEVGLFEPTASVRHLYELIQLRLESLALPGPVEKAHLLVVRHGRLVARQLELFSDRQSVEPETWRGLVDRLSSRLGRQSVLHARLQAAAQPERAFRLLPISERFVEGTASLGASSLSRCFTPWQRPLKLYSPPQEIEVVCLAPDGPPETFTFDFKAQGIARRWGPERIETGWWRGRCARRDYFRVETFNGQRFWLFRRLDDGRWFVHGEFG